MEIDPRTVVGESLICVYGHGRSCEILQEHEGLKERLARAEKEAARYKEALESIVDGNSCQLDIHDGKTCHAIARSALSAPPEGCK